MKNTKMFSTMTFYTDFPVIELDAISVEEDDVKYLLRAMISYDDLKVTKKGKHIATVSYKAYKMYLKGNNLIQEEVADERMSGETEPSDMALEFINKFNDLGDIVSSKSIAISGEDLPFFPKGTPLLSSLNHDEFLTFPECWNLFEYEIPATGWKTEFQSMTPPKGEELFGTISFSCDYETDTGYIMPAKCIVAVHNMSGFTYNIMETPLSGRLDHDNIKKALMSAKDMLTFYEVNSSNIHILDEPDATEYIDEGPMIPVFNPMYSDFEKGKFRHTPQQIMLAYSKNAPIVNFRSVVPPGQFKRETEAFGGAFYYDRKEGMIVTELEYSEEDTNILKGSLTLKKPVHDDETIEDAMKTCIKEVVNFLSPKKGIISVTGMTTVRNGTPLVRIDDLGVSGILKELPKIWKDVEKVRKG